MEEKITEAKALELDIIDANTKYLMPDAEDLIIRYKALEDLVKKLKEQITEKVVAFFKGQDMKIEKVEGSKIYITMSSYDSYEFFGDYKDKKAKKFLKVEYKPNSEMLREYEEKNGKLPDGFSKKETNRTYIKPIRM